MFAKTTTFSSMLNIAKLPIYFFEFECIRNGKSSFVSDTLHVKILCVVCNIRPISSRNFVGLIDRILNLGLVCFNSVCSKRTLQW